MKLRHALWLILLQVGCSASSVTEPAVNPEPTITVAPRRELAAVSHEGPLAVSPGFYDCGEILEGLVCEFDIEISHREEADLEILEVAQDFSVFARIGLVEHRTGFSRDLPYLMSSQETLRLLFSYRRDDPGEVVGGSLYIRYRQQDLEHRLEIPVGADN